MAVSCALSAGLPSIPGVGNLLLTQREIIRDIHGTQRHRPDANPTLNAGALVRDSRIISCLHWSRSRIHFAFWERAAAKTWASLRLGFARIARRGSRGIRDCAWPHLRLHSTCFFFPCCPSSDFLIRTFVDGQRAVAKYGAGRVFSKCLRDPLFLRFAVTTPSQFFTTRSTTLTTLWLVESRLPRRGCAGAFQSFPQRTLRAMVPTRQRL